MSALQPPATFDLPLLDQQVVTLRIQEHDGSGALIDITGRHYVWRQSSGGAVISAGSDDEPLAGTGVGLTCTIVMSGAHASAVCAAARIRGAANEVYRPVGSGNAAAKLYLATGRVIPGPALPLDSAGSTDAVSGPIIDLIFDASLQTSELRVAGSVGAGLGDLGLFEEVTNLTGAEELPLVQDGVPKRSLLSKIVALTLAGVAPLLPVSVAAAVSDAVERLGHINLATYPEWASVVPIPHVVNGGPSLGTPTDISFLVNRAQRDNAAKHSGGIYVPNPPDGYNWLCAADPDNMAATPLYINAGRLVNGVRVFDADGAAYTKGFTLGGGGSSGWLRGVVKVGVPWAISSQAIQNTDASLPHYGEAQASLGVKVNNIGVVGSLDLYCLQNESVTRDARVIPYTGGTGGYGYNAFFCNTLNNFALRVDLGTRFGMAAGRVESSPGVKFFGGAFCNSLSGLVFTKTMTYSEYTQSPLLLGTRFEGNRGCSLSLSNTSTFIVQGCDVVGKGQWDPTISPMVVIGGAAVEGSTDVDSSVNGAFRLNILRGAGTGVLLFVGASNGVNVDDNRLILGDVGVQSSSLARNLLYGQPGVDANLYSSVGTKRVDAGAITQAPLSAALQAPGARNALMNATCLVAQRVTAAPVSLTGARTVGSLDRWYNRLVSGSGNVTTPGTFGSGGGRLSAQNLGTGGAESTMRSSGWVYTGAFSHEFSQRISAGHAALYAGKPISGSVIAQTNAVNDVGGTVTATLSLWRCATKNVFDGTMVQIGTVAAVMASNGNTIAFDGWSAGDCSLGMEWRLQFDTTASSGGAAREFEAGLAMLSRDATHQPFESRTFAEEYAECRRYFWKSYNQADAPGALTDAGELWERAGLTSATTGLAIQASFGVPMSTAAALQIGIYSPVTGAGGVAAPMLRDNTASADAVATADHVGDAGCIVRTLAAVPGGTDACSCHVTASIAGF